MHKFIRRYCTLTSTFSIIFRFWRQITCPLIPRCKNFLSSWTKTTSILSKAMSLILKSALVDHMAENPFSIVNDDSDNCGLSKMNPVCVYIFDVQQNKQMEMTFFSMCSTLGEDYWKSKTLFDSINNTFGNNGMDWENVELVGLNNTNINMGEHSSLKNRIHTENLETFIDGYNCQLAHIAVCKGEQGYCSATGFDCEEHQINLFYFFRNNRGEKAFWTSICNSLDLSGKMFCTFCID